MAEPARKHSHGEDREPDTEPSVVLLQRWVERPDGRLELLEMPLTPEDFLDPQLEDKMVQGWPHSRNVHILYEMLESHLQPEDDVIVLSDVKHLLGPGLPGPSPDVSVIRGARNPDPDLSSFDVTEQGVVPCLVIEVVSPFDARIRRTDEVDKVRLYERVGIPEYVLVFMPRRKREPRFRLKGHRLGSGGRYRPIELDAQGLLLSETTHLRFGVSPAGDRIVVIDDRTGEQLLSPKEEKQARRTAEAELERLRAEIDRDPHVRR
ncbi:MAG TPA: Uma2 family endonuclease [Thermoanaerobaculia bacterium]|nr:Uma2 family endonuclease [Thermoanaerobaculia bacterium]